jgi:hypothetical protein
VAGHWKRCELEDFADPHLRRFATELFPREDDAVNFASGHESRDAWEIAQAARAPADLGALSEHAELLGVAPGVGATRHPHPRIAARGSEEDVWQGMQRTITKNPGLVLILELNVDRFEDPRGFLEAIEDARFRLRSVDFDAEVKDVTISY